MTVQDENGKAAPSVDAKDPEIQRLKEKIELAFHKTGERERIKELTILKLRDMGWAKELRNLCKEIINKRGIDNISAEDLHNEVRGQARKDFPDEVRAEMTSLIRKFVSDQTKVEEENDRKSQQEKQEKEQL